MPVSGESNKWAHIANFGARDFRWQIRVPRDAPVLFLKTELDVGLTFAWIALNSYQIGWHHKAERNRAAARRAYDALVRFRNRAALTALQSENFEHGFAFLQERLRLLGEAI